MASLANRSGNAAQHGLLEALFDFEALPGRYPLTLREPRALFDRSHQVLMIAAGRSVTGLQLDPAQASRAQRAACFFVRMAMLRSGADHYTLLGLPPTFQAATLRDHYRLLMRLTHPDFAGDASGWPRDAATRINLANDVLSSRVQRAEYDRQLAKTAPRRELVDSLAAVLPRTTSRQFLPAAWAWVRGNTTRLIRLRPWGQRRPHARAWAFGAGGVGVLVLGLMLIQGSGKPDVSEPVQVAEVVLTASEPAALLPRSTQADLQLLAPVQPSLLVSAPAVAPVRAARAVRVRVEDAEQARTAVQSRQSEQPVPAVQVAQLEPVALAALDVASPALRAVEELKSVPRAAAPIRAASEAVRSNPTLAEAQAAMGDLIQAMQGGQGEDVLRSLEHSLRQSGGAIDLVNAYKLLVGDSRAVRLRTVRLRGRPDADQLVVDGTVQLVLNDQGQPAPVRELRLRAAFAQRGGQVVMTEISTGGARP